MLKLLCFLKPHAPLALTAVLLVIAQSIADLWLPRLMADIVDHGIATGDIAHIIRQGIIMLAVTLSGGVMAVVGSFCSSQAGSRFGRDLRLAVFRTIQGYSLEDFERLGASTLITRSTNDTTQIQNVVQMSMHMLARAPVMMGVSLLFALRLNRELAVVLLFALPVLGLSIVLVAKAGIPLFKKMQEKTDRVNLVLRESLSGLRVIRAFTREERESARFDEANRDLTSTALKAQRIMMILMPLLMLIMNLTTIGVMAFGAPRIAEGSLQVGSLMAFIQYATHVLFSLMILSSLFVTLPRAQISAQRLNEVLAVTPRIVDPAQPQALPLRGPAYGAASATSRGNKNAGSMAEARGALSFKGVNFRYPGATECALKNIDIDFKPGAVNAIIGSTGAGKTSLLSLALRLHDATAGRVHFDGIDVRDLSVKELRARIAYVPQKAGLFSGSVAENLRYGALDADEGALWRALEVAQAADFVRALPEGLESELAQGARNLSGGQKQRLAIARALVRDAELYLFDDSFSALDFATDARLRAALRTELARRGSDSAAMDGPATPPTVIIVAQRVGTIMDADHIVVLDEGLVAGQGTHRELLAACPVYREIVESQFTKDETEAGA